MVKFLQILVLGAVAMCANAGPVSLLPKGLQYEVPKKGDFSAAVTGTYVNFWSEPNFTGEWRNANVPEYQVCLRLPFDSSKMSSFSFENLEGPGHFSVTFYTGTKCDKNWTRQTAYFNKNTGIKFATLGPFDNKVRTIKIANFLTSNDAGYQSKPDSKVISLY